MLRSRILVASLVLSTLSIGAQAQESKILGRHIDYFGGSCTLEQTMLDIINYAENNNGRGTLGYDVKEKEAACARFDSRPFGQRVVVADRRVGTYFDPQVGLLEAYQFHVECGGGEASPTASPCPPDISGKVFYGFIIAARIDPNGLRL